MKPKRTVPRGTTRGKTPRKSPPVKRKAKSSAPRVHFRRGSLTACGRSAVDLAAVRRWSDVTCAQCLAHEPPPKPVKTAPKRKAVRRKAAPKPTRQSSNLTAFERLIAHAEAHKAQADFETENIRKATERMRTLAEPYEEWLRERKARKKGILERRSRLKEKLRRAKEENEALRRRLDEVEGELALARTRARKFVAQVKAQHGYEPNDYYKPTADEYKMIAHKTGLPEGEVYAMFVSP